MESNIVTVEVRLNTYHYNVLLYLPPFVWPQLQRAAAKLDAAVGRRPKIANDVIFCAYDTIANAHFVA